MSYNFKNYYAALGIDKSATAEDIRKAFQSLAKDLHPDLNPSLSAATRFQAVKEAYDVLRDPTQKSVYDKELAMNASTSYDPEELRRRAEAFRAAQKNRAAGQAGTAGPSGQARFTRVLEHLLRPRFLFVAAPLLALTSWYLTDKLSPQHTYSEYGEKVQAWFNPKTLRWETPAPWDPLYQAHRKNTKMVARRDVYLSVPPTGGAAIVSTPLHGTVVVDGPTGEGVEGGVEPVQVPPPTPPAVQAPSLDTMVAVGGKILDNVTGVSSRGMTASSGTSPTPTPTPGQADPHSAVTAPLPATSGQGSQGATVEPVIQPPAPPVYPRSHRGIILK